MHLHCYACMLRQVFDVLTESVRQFDAHGDALNCAKYAMFDVGIFSAAPLTGACQAEDVVLLLNDFIKGTDRK